MLCMTCENNEEENDDKNDDDDVRRSYLKMLPYPWHLRQSHPPPPHSSHSHKSAQRLVRV